MAAVVNLLRLHLPRPERISVSRPRWRNSTGGILVQKYLAGALRSKVLAFLNDRICGKAARALRPGALPSYIVVTPHLVHLAPLAAQNSSSGVQPVFVANGISSGDVEWLSRVSPEIPVLRLRASLAGNSMSLLPHGVVIDHIATASNGDFCVQDADCFVSNVLFWESMKLDPLREYAAAPFIRESEGTSPAFPETFMLYLNRDLIGRYRVAYGITAAPSARPRRRMRRLLAEAGFPEGRFLEPHKDYFDTLQQFWIAARMNGFDLRLVPGTGTSVHHVGGTSYMFRAFENLDHWDYWPLNVHYFHLRLLEMPRCERFRERFRALSDFHGTSSRLLRTFPHFASGWRRKESDLIIRHTNAAVLYGTD